MKINKFKKLKGSQYEIDTDQGKYRIHEDLILKYELLIKKELDVHIIEKIQYENQTYDAYDTSLKLIKNKLRSKKELCLLLEKKGFAKENIEDACILLEQQGYINDFNYATAYLHDRVLLSSDGPDKIRMNLINNGIKDDVIKQVLNDFPLKLQEEKIKKIITKQMKANHTKSSKNLMQKITISLVQLGYSRNLVSSLLEDFEVEDNEDIKKKEYDKIYKKLSRKYEGKELELKIRQKMYQKGFSYDGKS